MNNQPLEFASIEWLWDSGNIRCNLPSGEELTSNGTYDAVVATLTEMGADGWDVASCVANSNWIFWTMKRAV